jgi:hypothetical protein
MFWTLSVGMSQLCSDLMEPAVGEISPSIVIRGFHGGKF